MASRSNFIHKEVTDALTWITEHSETQFTPYDSKFLNDILEIIKKNQNLTGKQMRYFSKICLNHGLEGVQLAVPIEYPGDILQWDVDMDTMSVKREVSESVKKFQMRMYRKFYHAPEPPNCNLTITLKEAKLVYDTAIEYPDVHNPFKNNERVRNF